MYTSCLHSSHSPTMIQIECHPLSPRYCGSFTIIRRIGEVSYELELPTNTKVHPVFHVNRLRRALTRSNNLVMANVLVPLEDSQQLPHEPESVLNVKETQTCHTLYQEYLIKWKDQPVENATWERNSILRQLYPDFVLEDQDNS
ncbi:hypothetical protein O6H91_19G040500 [Diphasiastrum complanatum]|uniref:Uncharacterized protein n=1 Tax=Diphasiastrum complanatum TaxID=34168 RepID=A0ACC2AUE6_DIPCM|nr:hypothetical protein O6H91_19G040500 [Diphasiastrum complanatum]